MSYPIYPATPHHVKAYPSHIAAQNTSEKPTISSQEVTKVVSKNTAWEAQWQRDKDEQTPKKDSKKRQVYQENESKPILGPEFFATPVFKHSHIDTVV